MAELFCQKHGPYDASYGTCPYCAGTFNKRPPAPQPLGGSEEATDLGGPGMGSGGMSVDDLPTDLGYPGRPTAHAGDDDAPTELPPGRKGHRFLDEDEETDLGSHGGIDVTELEEQPVSLMGLLWVKEGHRRGHIYKITKDRTIIGRSEGDVALGDSKASNRHASIRIQEGQFAIKDLDSTNGTSVNGNKIDATTNLNENDVIKIGNTVLVLKVLN